jgi:hypothetical protein
MEYWLPHQGDALHDGLLNILGHSEGISFPSQTSLLMDYFCLTKEMRCMTVIKNIEKKSFRRNLLSFATNIVNGKFGCKTKEMRCMSKLLLFTIFVLKANLICQILI